MRRIQWNAVWEIVAESLLLLILAAVIYFTLRLGAHMEIAQCLSRSTSVLISLPVTIYFSVAMAME